MPDRGRKPTVSDTEILQHFALSPDPVFLASELADEFGMSRQGILSRLDDLDERGLLASKYAGGRRMFWITVAGKRYISSSTSSNSSDSQ